MRRTPYTERGRKDSQHPINKLKDPFELYAIRASKPEIEKMSNQVFSYPPEKNKRQFHLYQRNTRPQTKRPITVSRAQSQLKQHSEDQSFRTSKPKDLWVSTVATTDEMRGTQPNRDPEHSRGKIYRGSSWKPEERMRTPYRDLSKNSHGSRYTNNLTPREDRGTLRSNHISGGIYDLLNRNMRERRPSGSETKQEEKFFEYVMRFSYRTKKGSVPSNPNKVNQDSYIITPNIGGKTYQHFFGVCDGHGPLGHHVSSFIKNALPNCVVGAKNLQKNTSDALMKAFELTYQKLIKESGVDMSFSGSTIISAYLLQNKLYCCNVGDSRAVLGRFKSGSNKWQAIALSQDHKPSLPKEAQRIKKMGGRVEAYQDQLGEQIGPLRVWVKGESVPGLAMTRSFGDLVGASVGVSPVPEIKQFNLTQQDQILLIASDGVFEFLQNSEIIDLVAPFYENKQIQQASDKLLTTAHRSWTQNSSIIDDITFILIFINYNEL